MKTVLKVIADLLIGAGLVSAIVITCMVDSEGPVFDNIIRFYAVSAMLLIAGGLMTGLYRMIGSPEEIKYSDKKRVIVMFS